MPPPTAVFPASQLPAFVQVGLDGKKRKTEGGQNINLKKCELLGLVQYECDVPHPEISNSPVVCVPVQRWFRRCQDLKGQFMVETTAWENNKTTLKNSSVNNSSSRTDHWQSNEEASKRS